MFKFLRIPAVVLCGLFATQFSSLAVAQSPADDVTATKVKALTGALVSELADKCPVKPVSDRAAFESCRAALFADSLFKRSLKNYILWGRPPGGDINASLKEFRATQFGPEVFSGTYAPMWMFQNSFDIQYVAADKIYRVTVPAGFRNELDTGQYPYPFWHDAKKWTDYEDANTLVMWIDPTSLKVSQFTFYKRADKPAVAQSTKRHTPTFDGKWMWTDSQGQSQPAPTLFVGLFSEKNPHLAALDETYRRAALSMRDADCMSCHVPNNPDKMRRLVLLQTPLHAASEIDRVIKDVKQDRMPLDEMGIEKPLDPAKKQKLLDDAEAFARVVKLAREWEAESRAKAPSKVSKALAQELQAALK